MQIFGQGGYHWWDRWFEQNQKLLEAVFSKPSWGSETSPTPSPHMVRLLAICHTFFTNRYLLHQAREHHSKNSRILQHPPCNTSSKRSFRSHRFHTALRSSPRPNCQKSNWTPLRDDNSTKDGNWPFFIHIFHGCSSSSGS